ncbi:MAG: TetR/AcrR family transcriptional regulator [Propionibacteriaceae bacterium]|nr:TetR/AcrR family transcriptional regulator [Propionibacteriaceae bacterium]
MSATDGRNGEATEQLGTATQALANATALLSQALKRGLTEAGAEVSDQLASSLRAVSREIADASQEIGRLAGDHRRRSKADATRASLLAAARKVFAERGFEGAAVGDIAAEAGYTKGALYSQFASKEELFAEVTRQLAAEDAAWSAQQSSADLAATYAVAAPDADAQAMLLLSLEVSMYALRHPESRGQLMPLLTQSWETAARLVAAGHGRAERPEPHDRGTALGVLAVHTLASILAALSDDPDEASAAADRLLRRLLA